MTYTQSLYKCTLTPVPSCTCFPLFDRADATIRIQPLTSGYSSEVHGIITITVHSSLQGIIPLSEQEGSQSSHGTRILSSSIGIRENKASAAGTGTLVLHYKALDTGIRCTLSSKK